MVRGRRRRLPGAQAAVRWAAADARDVARIHGSSAGPAVAVPVDAAVPTVAGGLARWQRRVERRRLLVVARRGALPGVAAACLLQLGALAAGGDGAGLWLLPAALPAVAAVAFGLAHRTSPAAAARLLDRDLALGCRGQHRARARAVRRGRGESPRPRRARARGRARRARPQPPGGARPPAAAASRDGAARRARRRARGPPGSCRARARPLPPRRRRRRSRRGEPRPQGRQRGTRGCDAMAVPACRAACRRSSMHRRSRRWRPRRSGARAMRPRRAALMAVRRGMRWRAAPSRRRAWPARPVWPPRRMGATARRSGPGRGRARASSKTPAGSEAGSAESGRDGSARKSPNRRPRRRGRLLGCRR